MNGITQKHLNTRVDRLTTGSTKKQKIKAEHQAGDKIKSHSCVIIHRIWCIAGSQIPDREVDEYRKKKNGEKQCFCETKVGVEVIDKAGDGDRKCQGRKMKSPENSKLTAHGQIAPPRIFFMLINLCHRVGAKQKESA